MRTGVRIAVVSAGLAAAVATGGSAAQATQVAHVPGGVDAAHKIAVGQTWDDDSDWSDDYDGGWDKGYGNDKGGHWGKKPYHKKYSHKKYSHKKYPRYKKHKKCYSKKHYGQISDFGYKKPRNYCWKPKKNTYDDHNSRYSGNPYDWSH